MTTLVFDGLTLKCWQEDEFDFDISYKKTTLHSGDNFGSKGSKYSRFPLSFNCYADNLDEIFTIAGKIPVFGTLVIDGVSFSNCTIYNFGKIKKIGKYAGKYRYVIAFDQVDYHS
jgi:hypothetical protein